MKSESVTPDKSTAPLKRWWPQYSLRAFLVVVTLICLWVGWEANRAKRQKQAVEEVQRLGGVVRFDYQLDEKGALVADAQPSAPPWLREALGEEHFRRVVVLDLSYGGPRLGESRITNERLALLGGAPDLTTLELGRELGITDDGLVHLRRLKHLKTLYLYNTGVEGPGLRHLGRLEKLESVNMLGTPLTDEGLVHFGHMPRLRSLNLIGTRISDAGLEHLGGSRSLRELWLQDTDITDDGLKHIARIPELASVSVHRTRVTAGGVARLQAMLPTCSVSPTFDELDREPVDITLWPESERPTASELMKRAMQLGVDLDLTEDRSRPERPIVSLRLFDSDVSADCLIRLLAETPELEVLNLRRLVIGDDLLRKMPLLPKLRYFSLQDCRITDDALAHLAKHRQLRVLEIDGNSITDNGLATLQKLASLERLSLTGSRVTYKARLELKRAMPKVQMSL